MGIAMSTASRWLIRGVWYGGPLFVLDWSVALGIMVGRQLAALRAAGKQTGLAHPLSFALINFEAYVLLWGIEINHLMETALERRLAHSGTSIGNALAGLPHVNTASKATSASVGWAGLVALFGGSKKSAASGFTPIAKDLVLIGGGHSHAFVIKSLGMKPEAGVRVTLISDGVETPYSGMLPGFVGGAYSKEECHIDLGRLCRFGKVRLIVGRVCKVDKFRKLVYLEEEDRLPIGFDVLSIDIGSSPQLMWEDCDDKAVSPGSNRSSKSSKSNKNDVFSDTLRPTPVKPIAQFSDKWSALIRNITLSERVAVRVGIIGAGAGGVEIALAMQHRIHTLLAARRADSNDNKLIPKVCFVLVANGTKVCPQHNAGVQDAFEAILVEREVEVVRGFHVSAVNGGVLVARDGRELALDECVWCTNACAQSWIRESGLEAETEKLGGFMRVNATLESLNTPNVFGAGDCANVIEHPRPKAGVFAVRQGPPLAENLRRALRCQLGLEDLKLLPFEPQSSFLGIISAGPGTCVASRGEMALQGEWLWNLKDWIDRKWMASYSSQLPLMDDGDGRDGNNSKDDTLGQLTKASLMRCGGCGSKVGKTVLDKVMAELTPPTRPEVVIGLDAPDDCAVVAFDPKHPASSRVVQTVDFFRSFIDDPFVFGQIAANHSLSDCYAMCAQPVSAMAIAVMPFGSEIAVERDMAQMMAGVCVALQKCDCALIGGHSCEGQELALGLSVSGVPCELDDEAEYYAACDDENEKATAASKSDKSLLLTKGGVQEGDVIVLTKPLGTGVIFAADMRVLAKGQWVQAAIQSMLASNQAPALIGRDLNATACTDVTGFGMLGHLIEMMEASEPGLIAEISLDDVPLLPGALELMQAGVFSSLQPENKRLKHAISNQADAIKHEAYPLIFDPQTSGGLLVTLPSAKVDEYISTLRESFSAPQAAIVGQIIRPPLGEDKNNRVQIKVDEQQPSE